MTIPLTQQVTRFFTNYNDHIVRNLLVVSQAVFASKTTNLNRAKDQVSAILENQDTTMPESNYKRMIRFFNLPDEEKERLVESLLYCCFFLLNPQARQIKYLTLDGTSWEFGSKKIHLLVLSIVVDGVSIPIGWEDLDKKGTSNFSERKHLIDRAFERFNLAGLTLLADREFNGEQWFKYLKDKGLNFVIRLRKNDYRKYVDNQRTGRNAVYKHQHHRYIGLEREAHKKIYAACGVIKRIQILSESYSFVVFKNPKKNATEPLIYFISTLTNKKRITKAYPIRWSIESCSSSLGGYRATYPSILQVSHPLRSSFLNLPKPVHVQ